MTIENRIFLGFLLANELLLFLNQSKEWREAKILGNTPLKETHYQGKTYIGMSLPSILNCDEIKEKEKEIKTLMQLYCPRLDVDRQNAYLFSEHFIL